MKISINSLKSKFYLDFLLRGPNYLLIPIFISLILMLLLGVLLPSVLDWAIKDLNDNRILWIFFCILISDFCAKIVYNISLSFYVMKSVSEIRKMAYENWLKAKEIGHHKYTLGEVLSRLVSDIEAMTDLISHGPLRIIGDILFVMAYLLGFIFLNGSLGLLVVSLEIVSIFVLLFLTGKMSSFFVSSRFHNGKMSSAIADCIGGLKEGFFSRENTYIKRKLEKSFDGFLLAQKKSNIVDCSYYSLADSLYPIFLLIIASALPSLELKTFGILVVCVDMVQRSVGPLKDITGRFASIQKGLASFKRIKNFIDDHEVRPRANISLSLSLDKKILDEIFYKINKFEHAERSIDLGQKTSGKKNFNGNLINKKKNNKNFSLKDIFIHVKRGEMLGVVGGSGAGKTTLISLMSLEENNFDGEFKFLFNDGQKIIYEGNSKKNSLDADLSLKELISVVNQDPFIFHDTLLFNISFAQDTGENFSDFWLKMQVKIPYLEIFNSWKSGVINPLDLSSGQRQLLSALRAIYFRRPIVFLDEVSSSLDSDLAEALMDALDIFKQFAITFIVAHRPETIKNTDRIIVINDGKVEKIGKHESLLNNCRTYKDYISKLEG